MRTILLLALVATVSSVPLALPNTGEAHSRSLKGWVADTELRVPDDRELMELEWDPMEEDEIEEDERELIRQEATQFPICRRWKVDRVKIVTGEYSDFASLENGVLGVTFFYRDGTVETWGRKQKLHPYLEHEYDLSLSWDEVLARVERFVYQGTTRGIKIFTSKGQNVAFGFQNFKVQELCQHQICPWVPLESIVTHATLDDPIVRFEPKQAWGVLLPATLSTVAGQGKCGFEATAGYFCPRGYDQTYGDLQNIVGLSAINGKGGGERVENCDVCASLCESEDECAAFECSPSNTQCWLSRSPEPTSPKVEDFVFCSKSALCAGGYEQATGELQNIDGLTAINGRGGGEAIGCQACAALCDEEEACAAYECSATSRQCWFSRSPEPTSPKVEDYFFCAKGG